MKAVLEASRIVGKWVGRTGMYRAARRKLGARPEREYEQQYEFSLSPLPAWQNLTEEDRRRRIAEIVTAIERETAEDNLRLGREPAGPTRIMSQDPFSQPRRSKRNHSPRFLWLSNAARTAMLDAYRSFAAAYREASLAYRQGNLEVAFPPWSFPPPRPMTCGPPAAEMALSCLI